jgi:Protein of unknown function (DUF2911)
MILMVRQVILSAALACMSVGMMAQMPAGEQQSPKEQAGGTIAGKKITIDYSSPRVRGRQGKIFTKDGLISHDPHYPVWRAGANDATLLKTEANLMIGSLMIPAGSYTLFVDISNPAEWTLVVSKALGEWGLEYDPTKDLGRVKMKMAKPAAMVENLKWTIKQTMGSEGTISLEWENMGAAVQVMVH